MSDLIKSELDKHIEETKAKLVIEIKPEDIEFIGEPTTEALAVPDPTRAKIDFIIQQTKDLVIQGPDDLEGEETVNKARKLKKRMRGAVKAWKDESKADLLKQTRAIDARHNELWDLLEKSEEADEKKLNDVRLLREQREAKRLADEQERYNRRAAGLLKLGMIHNPVECCMEIKMVETFDGVEPVVHTFIIRDEVVRMAPSEELKRLVNEYIMPIVELRKNYEAEQQRIKDEAETQRKLKEAEDAQKLEEQAEASRKQHDEEERQRKQREDELREKTLALEAEIREYRTEKLTTEGMVMGEDLRLHLAGITVDPANLHNLDGAGFERLIKQCKETVARLTAALEQEVIGPSEVANTIAIIDDPKDPQPTQQGNANDVAELTKLYDYLGSAPEPVLESEIAKHGMREISKRMIYTAEYLHGLIKELRT